MTDDHNNGWPPDAFEALGAEPPTRLERAKVEILRLARLLEADSIAYELELPAVAKALDMRVSALDALVKKRAHTVLPKSFEHSNDQALRLTARTTSACSNDCSKGVRTEAEIERWRALGASILEADDPLEPVREAFRALGFAGDTRLPELLYVAIASRFQVRPINIHVEALSASGKNFAITCALALHPEDAVYLLSASSPRALIYSDATFTNRVVVLAEADSVPADGPAASAIRSIAEDSCLTYETVEKDPETGKFVTRRIIKAGPTGFVTSGIRPLDRQMSTRCLTATVPDDPIQTRAVLQAEAAAAIGGRPAQDNANLEAFHAAHRWLDEAGEKRVVVPFARVLADLVPASVVRVRRDFRQLLSCIQTLAFLSQSQRTRTPDGAIVATLEDYDRARRLLSPLFDSLAAEGVTPAIRETVLAVNPEEEISVTELARRLSLVKSTISYRVHKALRAGWLKNSETRRSYPAKLSRGEPLPEDISALPEVEKLREAFERAQFEHSSNDPSNITKAFCEKDLDGACSNVRMKIGVRCENSSAPPETPTEKAEIDRLAFDDGWNGPPPTDAPDDDEELPF
jgi:hypothetical protein